MLTSQEIHWAAGFLDGEGHFAKPGKGRGKSARVNAVQKDAWPLEKLSTIFGGKIYRYQNRQVGRGCEGQWYYRWELYGNRAAGVMMTLYCLLSPRRQERIRDALAEWKSRSYHNIGRFHREATHCKRGHEFTPENTYAKDGKYRQCRTCQREAGLRWYHAHKPT